MAIANKGLVTAQSISVPIPQCRPTPELPVGLRFTPMVPRKLLTTEVARGRTSALWPRWAFDWGGIDSVDISRALCKMMDCELQNVPLHCVSSLIRKRESKIA